MLCGRTPTGDCPTATTHKTTQKAKAMGEAYCARKTLLQTRSFPLLEGGLAHMVSKRLLVAPKLKSKLRVPSEPFTELIPSSFGVDWLYGRSAILGVKGYPLQ